MVLELIGSLFNRSRRLPRDRTTRVPRSARKAAKPHIEAMAAAVGQISGLPGLADIGEKRRVPRGFYDLVDDYHHHYDAYATEVRRHLPIAEDARRPGEPGGCNNCYATPLGVTGIESLALYRAIRPWADFSAVGQRMAELGEAQFKLIQSGHSGKDPEKIRLGSRSVREGRIAFARNKMPCALLDVNKQRCRAFDQRPVVCRMHHAPNDETRTDPANPEWPRSAAGHNIRPPIKVQAALAQIDKRLALQLSPFLPAGILQLVQLGEGHLIQEVGEAPIPMQQDGRVSGRANRNRRGAKKFKKKKKKR